MTYKEKIEKIMSLTGWTQTKTALKCGRDQGFISRILSGQEPKSKTSKARIDDLLHEIEDQQVKQLSLQIEKFGRENTFWNTFDPYFSVVWSDEWDAAIDRLPPKLQELANTSGLNTCLDWDLWGNPSFFGLTFESSKASEYFDDYEKEYIAFLNEIEYVMWKIVINNVDYQAFCQALKRA